MDEKSGIGFVNASTRNLERKIHGGARSSRKKTVPIDQQTVGRSDRRERERGKFEKRQRDKARGNSSDRYDSSPRTNLRKFSRAMLIPFLFEESLFEIHRSRHLEQIPRAI